VPAPIQHRLACRGFAAKERDDLPRLLLPTAWAGRWVTSQPLRLVHRLLDFEPLVARLALEFVDGHASTLLSGHGPSTGIRSRLMQVKTLARMPTLMEANASLHRTNG